MLEGKDNTKAFLVLFSTIFLGVLALKFPIIISIVGVLAAILSIVGIGFVMYSIFKDMLDEWK